MYECGMSHPIYTPPSGPPQGNAPSLYAVMGESAIHTLSERFYTLLASSAIAPMFPAGDALTEAARRQAEFLIGILGGPPLYAQKYGPPRMRARHFPFAIDSAARAEWLRCFRTALGDGSAFNLSPEQSRDLLAWLEAFSAWMVNRPD